MAKITALTATEILNSKGNPTIEAVAVLDDGSIGVADVPSGASVGSHEAVELKDMDPARYGGAGMLRAIENIEKLISPQLVGMEAGVQSEIDNAMIQLDGTDDKSRLGANSILAVSMAVTKAAAMSQGVPLYRYIHSLTKREDTEMKIPTPLFNIINGGKHAGENINMQEFIVIPATFKSFTEGLQMGVMIYKKLQEVLHKGNFSTLVGDEGGYGPNLATNEDALSLISQAVELATYRLGYDVFTGIDAAGSSFYLNKKYKIKDKNIALSAADLTEFYKELIEKYHILYLEDALAEDDWEGWQTAYNSIDKDIILTGDDLTVTNPIRLQMALEKKTISGIIIKPNQIGTVSESIAVVEMAREAGIKVITSHRSGETNDDFIADFAVGVTADYVKFGAPARGERVAKYNRLLQIDTQLKQ